jgi:hypothetical protein
MNDLQPVGIYDRASSRCYTIPQMQGWLLHCAEVKLSVNGESKSQDDEDNDLPAWQEYGTLGKGLLH